MLADTIEFSQKTVNIDKRAGEATGSEQNNSNIGMIRDLIGQSNEKQYHRVDKKNSSFGNVGGSQQVGSQMKVVEHGDYLGQESKLEIEDLGNALLNKVLREIRQTREHLGRKSLLPYINKYFNSIGSENLQVDVHHSS